MATHSIFLPGKSHGQRSLATVQGSPKRPTGLSFQTTTTNTSVKLRGRKKLPLVNTASSSIFQSWSLKLLNRLIMLKIKTKQKNRNTVQFTLMRSICLSLLLNSCLFLGSQLRGDFLRAVFPKETISTFGRFSPQHSPERCLLHKSVITWLLSIACASL